MKTQLFWFVAIWVTWSIPAYARIGADILISPTNSSIEGLSFEVTAVEHEEHMETTVVVTWMKSADFPINIHPLVVLNDKDGFLGSVPVSTKIDGNHMTIFVTFHSRIIDSSEIVVSTVNRYFPVDPKTNQPRQGSSGIVAGRAYRIQIGEFIKK